MHSVSGIIAYCSLDSVDNFTLLLRNILVSSLHDLAVFTLPALQKVVFILFAMCL